MKKIVFLSLFALSLPLGMMAQSNNDDLYFIPSKDKEEPAPVKKEPQKREATTTIYTAPGTTVVVQDRKGNARDVDEYNRRYDSRDNEFVMEDDTLYVNEKEQPDLDGEWVNGEFEGSQDDYEYAERIIRFRNPRYAISISSPLYWDVVYGANSWDWNVYTDGLYAYAFPTFSNRLWWDWRYNSYGSGFGFGWGSPYYGGYAGYWGGWYGGWGGGWGHHHHHGYYPGWGGGGHHWANNTIYTNRRSEGVRTVTDRRSGSTSQGRNTTVRRAGTESRVSTGRVVGTRTPNSSVRQGASSRTDASSRRNTYTRPSSTRNSSDYSTREGVRNSTRTVSPTVTRPSTNSSRSSSYNRGSSTAPSRSTSTESTRRSYDSGNSSSSRSYSPSSSGSSSRSSGTSSGGGSSRSGGGGGSSRSSGSRR